MTAIIHRTPGTLDMRAFSIMGLSAKPGSERPIGIFGTGLKYGVAVLLRLGASLEVHTGGHRYWFETRPGKFRGDDFRQIVMRRDSWTGSEGWRIGRRQTLPFTLNYGINWQCWMAFRELFANTLDEGGETSEVNATMPETLGWAPGEGETFIIVSNCPDYVEAYRNRGDIFLDLGQRELRAKLPGLEVRLGETQRMFYQGLRALDIGKPALFTYNVVASQHLTEDRQLGREWAVRSLIADTIATCDDEALIETVIKADKDHWEHGLAPNSWTTPSEAFHRVMARRPRGVSSGWGSYYGSHDTRPEVALADPWVDALRPWRVDGGDVVDASGAALLSRPFTLNEQKWGKLAGRIVAMANEDLPPSEREPVPAAEAICPTCDNTVAVCESDRLCERAGVLVVDRSHTRPVDGDDIPF